MVKRRGLHSERSGNDVGTQAGMSIKHAVRLGDALPALPLDTPRTYYSWYVDNWDSFKIVAKSDMGEYEESLRMTSWSWELSLNFGMLGETQRRQQKELWAGPPWGLKWMAAEDWLARTQSSEEGSSEPPSTCFRRLGSEPIHKSCRHWSQSTCTRSNSAARWLAPSIICIGRWRTQGVVGTWMTWPVMNCCCWAVCCRNIGSTNDIRLREQCLPLMLQKKEEERAKARVSANGAINVAMAWVMPKMDWRDPRLMTSWWLKCLLAWEGWNKPSNWLVWFLRGLSVSIMTPPAKSFREPTAGTGFCMMMSRPSPKKWWLNGGDSFHEPARSCWQGDGRVFITPPWMPIGREQLALRVNCWMRWWRSGAG